jgi:hypothetical protein
VTAVRDQLTRKVAVSLKERVEQVLKEGAGSDIDLTNRYFVDEVKSGLARVGARRPISVADHLGNATLVGHPYDDSSLMSCEIRLAEDGFLIEWVPDPAGDYLLVREATAG